MTRTLISSCGRSEFTQILENIAGFWGSEDTERLNRISILHHPLFIHEFPNCSFVIKHNETVVAYLLGLVSETTSTGYIHMISCLPDHRRNGYAKQLVNHFSEFCKSKEYKYIKAITSVTNSESQAFHKSCGFHNEGNAVNKSGVKYYRNYAGADEDRVVFIKTLYASRA